MLRDFASSVYAKIPVAGTTIAKMAQILNGMRGFRNSAELYSLPVAARFVSFAKIYRKLFKLAGGRGSGQATHLPSTAGARSTKATTEACSSWGGQQL